MASRWLTACRSREGSDKNTGSFVPHSMPSSVILIAMSKRLQVILDDREMKEIRSLARRRRMTVADWVRGALRAAKAEETGHISASKIARP